MSVTPVYRPQPRVGRTERRVPVQGPTKKRPTPTSKPRSRPVQSVRAASLAGVVTQRAVWFSILAGVAYMASSLGGQVMLEQARGQGSRFVARSKDARRAEAQLRARINAMSNLDTVESWAATHGFVAPGQTASEPKVD